jgi:hypothetical protein
MKVRWTPTAILVAALLALVGCGGGGSLVGFEDASVTIAFDAPDGMDASDDLVTHRRRLGPRRDLRGERRPTTTCVDRDNDRYGFGLGCINVDCDDDNASVTDQCYCGRLPNTRAGCECRLGDQPRPCDVDNDLTYSATETCNVGQRTCDPVPGSPEAGRWSECRRWRPDYPTPTRFIGVVSQCPGNCSPQCRHQVICPEGADAIPAGSSNVDGGQRRARGLLPGRRGPARRHHLDLHQRLGQQLHPGTSPLSWRDACAAPGRQTVLMGSDDGTTQLPLPFTFRFYGASYVTAGIATNGMISFVDPTYWWVNSSLPTADVANTIFAFWDDVYNRGSGECIAVYGSSPNREYVVQWNDQFFYPPGSSNATEHMTYQVVLAETTHTIDVLYNQMEGQGDRATGNSATIGIQQGTGLVLRPGGQQLPGRRPGRAHHPLDPVERLHRLRHGHLPPHLRGDDLRRHRRAVLGPVQLLLDRPAGDEHRVQGARGADLARASRAPPGPACPTLPAAPRRCPRPSTSARRSARRCRPPWARTTSPSSSSRRG